MRMIGPHARLGCLLAVSTASLLAGCSDGSTPPAPTNPTSATLSVAAQHLGRAPAILTALGRHGALTRERLEVDGLTLGHVVYGQRFRGLPVFEGAAIVHVDPATGSVFDTTNALEAIPEDLDTTPSLTKAAAEAIAQRSGEVPAGIVATTDLLVFPARNGRTARLAFRVVHAGDTATGPVNRVSFVDAHAGEVLFSFDNVQYAAAQGTAKTRYIGAAVPVTTNQLTSTSFELVDPSRGNMSSVNLAFGMSGGSVFTDSDNLWGNGTIGDLAGGGAEALIGAQATYDYFAQTFGRRGIANDGLGSQQRVHYLSSYNNAFWNDACKCMTYGDGDGTKFGPTYAIDVSAHEMTHGIIGYTAQLTYAGESGALNESLADIFGTLVEYYASTRPGVVKTANYLIGEDIVTPGVAGDFLRSMSNPRADGKSIDHASQNIATLYATTPAINGLHYASGLTNNAFYLLAEGGRNATSGITVSGIGRSKGAAIFYRAMTLYMTASTNFAGARTATLNAARDLYGATSLEWNTVANAWYACGVGTPGGTVIADAGVAPVDAAVDSGIRTDAAVDSGIRTDAATADAGSAGTIASWSGSVLSGYTKFHNTASLAAGTYVVAMSGSGDADLYVKIGSAPTTTSYTCRPYVAGMSETCTITLASTNAIYVMVKGVAVTSSYTVSVTKR